MVAVYSIRCRALAYRLMGFISQIRVLFILRVGYSGVAAEAEGTEVQGYKGVKDSIQYLHTSCQSR
jgi:hypothetical protein